MDWLEFITILLQVLIGAGAALGVIALVSAIAVAIVREVRK